MKKQHKAQTPHTPKNALYGCCLPALLYLLFLARYNFGLAFVHNYLAGNANLLVF